jgi:hypothetical protein
MRRSIMLAVLIVLLPAFSVAAEPESKAEKSPLVGDGFFKDVKQPIGQMLGFTFDGPRLKLDRKAWGAAPKQKDAPVVWVGPGFGAAHPIETLFRTVQNAAGAGGSGMSISNNDRRVNFNGGKMNGLVHTRGDQVTQLQFQETGDSGRTLEFGEDGKGGFRLQFSHTDGDIILLSQTPKGAFRAIAMVNGKTFAGQAESFTAFYKQHRSVMESDILPILAHVGVQPIMSPQEAKVKHAVAALLQRSPASVEEGKKLVSDLDSEQFAVREAATKALTERFQLFQDLVREKQLDKTASLEMRTRLDKIMAANTDASRVNQTVELLDLTKDPGYLISLIDGPASPETAKVVEQLEKVSGQKLGSDAKAWKQWLEKSSKK